MAKEPLTTDEWRTLRMMVRDGEITQSDMNDLVAEREGTMPIAPATPSAPAATGPAGLTDLPEGPMVPGRGAPSVQNAMSLTYDPGAEPAPGGVGAQVQQWAREAALPTIGGAVGAGVGGLATLPLLGTGAVPGEMLGSAAGESLNQLFGITPRSNAQIAAAGVAPPIMRGVMKGGMAGVRWLGEHAPGAAATLHEMGVETLNKIPALVRPLVDPETLWAPVRRLNPKMLMSEFSRTVDKALREAAGGLKGAQASPEIINRLRNIQADLARRGDDVPFRIIDKSRKIIGAWTRSDTDEKRTLGKFLYGPLMRDYEKNAALGGAQQQVVDLLKPAIKASYGEFTAQRLEEVIKAGLTRSSQTGTRKILGAKIFKSVLDDPELVKRFTPDQLAEVKRLLLSIRNLPAEQPVRGVNFGFGATGARAGGGYALGKLAESAGLEGADAATFAAVATFAPMIIGRAVATDTGRAALRKVIEAEGGNLTATGLAAIAHALRNEFAPGVESLAEGTRAKLGMGR